MEEKINALAEEMAEEVAFVMIDLDEDINYQAILESWEKYFKEKMLQLLNKE